MSSHYHGVMPQVVEGGSGMVAQVAQKTFVKWIIPVPESDPYGKVCFTAACRGNSDIGEMLNYFLYAASKEVENGKADLSRGFITIKRNLDTIADYLKVSVKTAISYIRKLCEWEFIISHSYHHTYDVCFQTVTEAIKNPPPLEWPKRRGKYAAKCKDGKSTISTICAQDGRDGKDEQIEHLKAQMVNLQSEMVDLQSEMVNLQSQMVNLQSLQSSQAASDMAVSAQNDALQLLTITNGLPKDYTLTYVSDDAPIRPYADGLQAFQVTHDDLEALNVRLMNDVLQEQMSTSYPHPLVEEAAQPTSMQPYVIHPPTKPFQQALSTVAEPTKDDTTLFPASTPVSREAVKPASAHVTHKSAKNKKALTLQGQHYLDLYQDFKGVKRTPGEVTIKAANSFGELSPPDAFFIEVLTEIRDNDALNRFDVQGRDLDFAWRKWEKYAGIVQDRKAKKASAPVGSGSGMYKNMMAELAAQRQLYAQGT